MTHHEAIAHAQAARRMRDDDQRWTSHLVVETTKALARAIASRGR